MNWLDRTVGWFAPQRGLRRARARMALQVVDRAYEGAGIGRNRDGWITSFSDANSEIGAARGRLVSRSRDLVRNNAWAGQAVKVLVSNVIGAGIVPRADNTTDEVFARWAEEADAAGRTDFYGLQALIMRGIVESGEMLIRLRVRRPSDGLAVPMQLELLEPDFLDTTKDITAVAAGGGYIEQGIEYDAIGRRRGYWLFRNHPLGQAVIGRTSLESRFVPAREILHVYDPLRAGQSRGVPWFAAAIIKLRDVDEYDEAELMRKKIEACFAAFVTTDDESTTLGPAHIVGGSVEGGPEKRIERIKPGMIEYMQPGRDVRFGEPKATGGYPEYMRWQMYAIAAGVDLTYELLTGDLSNVNFSSARIGLLEFRRRVKQRQLQMLLPQLLMPVWRWFTDIGRISGALSDEEGRIPVKWSLPRFEAIEPLKDAQAELIRVRSGTLSLAEAISAHGFDPADTLAEIADVNEALDDLGIVLDSDPRKTTNAGGARSSGGGAGDDEDMPPPDEGRSIAYANGHG